MRPATAISLIALFVALSGTSVALPGKNRVDRDDAKRGAIGTRAIANDSIRTQDIRKGHVRTSDIGDGSVTGTDVNEGTLGQVPRAAVAGSAGSATSAGFATSAGSAGSAQSATTAGSAANAGLLDGVDSTGFVKTDFNRVRMVSDTTADDNYGNNTALLTLSNLAPGTWSVTGKVDVNNDDASGVVITCSLVNTDGTTVIDSSLQILGALGDAASNLEYTVLGAVATGASGTDDLFIRCTNPSGTSDANNLRLMAHREN